MVVILYVLCEKAFPASTWTHAPMLPSKKCYDAAFPFSLQFSRRWLLLRAQTAPASQHERLLGTHQPRSSRSVCTPFFRHGPQPRSHLPSPSEPALPFSGASIALNLSQLRDAITQSIFKNYKLVLRCRLSTARLVFLYPLLEFLLNSPMAA